jgi:hypothetical protein
VIGKGYSIKIYQIMSNCNYLFLFMADATGELWERALRLLARAQPSLPDSRRSLTDAVAGMNAAREKSDAMGEVRRDDSRR